MRYVPHLIPAHSKVLPDYFKGNLYKSSPRNKIAEAFLYLIAAFFILMALAFLPHFILFLIFGFTGFILLPMGHVFMERKFRFHLTGRIKASLIAILLVSSIPLIGHYSTIDRRIALQQKLKEENKAREEAIIKHKAQQRQDSFNFFIQESRQMIEHHKPEQAMIQLQRASAFADTGSETTLLETQRTEIASIKVSDQIKAGKYQAALSEIDPLITANPSNADLRYNRAICYSKTGKIREAVNDLSSLIRTGHEGAEKLYNKINPVRKRIIGYETLCCDGSTSSARGRGACSHHGGVCDWNHPIYEEYRKYD